MMTTENNAIATLTDRQKIEVSCTNIINPGDWFAKRWAVLVSYGYSGDWYIVEASCESDAIDLLVESGKADYLVIDPEDLDDYRDESGDYRCSFAGDGTPYDTEWITGLASVESVEFPVSDEDASTREEVVSSVARTAFACDWADAIENAPESTQGALPSLSGVDIIEVCPFNKMPDEYTQWAEKSIRDVESANGASIVAILKQLDPDDADSRHFGHYLALTFAGHGTGLWDEYDSTGGEDVSVPSCDFPSVVHADNILDFIDQ